MNALSVKNLTKKYPSFTLENISFSLETGRIMGLIGVNGAGKTTTLKCLLNMATPNEGQIEMLGLAFPENEMALKQQIGVVFGGIDFYQHKRLSAITAVTRRFYPKWDHAAYERFLKLFDLDPKKRVNQLSQGMRVKYLIALALSHHAKLLILDEPTSGLDPVSRDDLLELFRQIVKTGQCSILFSTHITSDLDKCADDITYIKDGKLLASAEKNVFLASFEHLKTKEDTAPLTLEDIMLRTERSNRYDEFTL